jgi:hypothetical protein
MKSRGNKRRRKKKINIEHQDGTEMERLGKVEGGP